MEQTKQTPQKTKTSTRKWIVAGGLVASLALIGIVGAKALEHEMSKNGMGGQRCQRCFFRRLPDHGIATYQCDGGIP